MPQEKLPSMWRKSSWRIDSSLLVSAVVGRPNGNVFISRLVSAVNYIMFIYEKSHVDFIQLLHCLIVQFKGMNETGF